jgi:hypothetical protein
VEDAMMLRGFLLGICVALISVFLFFRWITASLGLPPGTAISLDIRSLQHFAASFFGGMGIGFAVVLGLASGAVYGLWLHLQNVIKQQGAL